MTNNRVVLPTKKSYNTKSNKRRILKTPGGKLTYHRVSKLPSKPKCGDCHISLSGIPSLPSRKYSTISKRQKTVNRSYGGSRCGGCVRERITRAFLVEEAKIVKRLSKEPTTKKK